MKIRGEEGLLPLSAMSAFPRPHWLQGRVFGSRSEPTYRSHNLRVSYEDAVMICAAEQDAAGLDVLTDGAQYYEWETPETIADRIRRALEIVPPDRLLVTPDCGLGYFSRTTAYAKLRNMGRVAEMVRAELQAQDRPCGSS